MYPPALIKNKEQQETHPLKLIHFKQVNCSYMHKFLCDFANHALITTITNTPLAHTEPQQKTNGPVICILHLN